MCADAVLSEHIHRVADVVRASGARVVTTGADSTVVAFESASAAVTASVQLQQTLGGWMPALPIRIGLCTGDVEWTDDVCSGPALRIAAELFARARPGQILANNVVRWLAGNAAFTHMGFAEADGEPPVEMFAVEWQSVSAAGSNSVATHHRALPLPAALCTAPRQRLVGRESEWAELAEAWKRSEAGALEVVLIGGEAGAGKTRLAAEVARHCHDTGASVLLGTCDAELALPYQPWVHALDHLLRCLPDFGRPALSNRDLADLLVLLPQLERMLPGLPRPPASDPETERYLLFSAVDRVLSIAAHSTPMVILLDDLHWAGRQTLELLRHLVRSGSAAHLMIIATFRDSAADHAEAFAECLVELQRSECVSRIRLGGLDVAGVEQYVAGALGQELDGDLRMLAAAATERSGGNAFFLGELWRHLIHHGVVVRQDDRWVVRRDISSVGAPDSVKEVVGSRMARLSRRARRPLELAAVAGQRVESRVLSLATGMAADEVAAGLDELVDCGFLVVVGGHLLTYQFGHALVRDTVEEVMSRSVRAALHLRIAEALEQIYEPDQRSVYAELARHFCAASAVGGLDRGVAYGRLAAAQAKSSGAYDEAISHLQAIVGLVPSESVEATELQVELGQVQMRKGHAFKAQDTYKAAFESARRNGRAEQAAHAALGYEEAVHQPGAPGGPAVRMVSEAIRLIGDQEGPLPVHLQASLSRSLYLAGDQAGAIDAGETALAMARAIDDPESLIAVLQALTVVSADPPRMLEASTELRDVAMRIGDSWSAAYATGTMFRVQVVLGDLAQAAEVLKQHHVLADRGRFLVFQFMAEVYETILALAAGRFDDAEQFAERAHAIGYSSDTVFDAGVYGLQMFAIRREQGRLADVLPLMRLLSEGDGQAIWQPGLTVLYAELGMIDDARRQLESLAPGVFAVVPRDSVWPACLTFLAEACIACADMAHAELLLSELDQYAGRNLMVAMTTCFGPADRLRGGLAHLLGRVDDAETHFQAAMALADRSESPVWRAHVHHDWGLLALANGDLTRAHALAKQALETATALGMGTLVQKATALVERSVSVTLPQSFDGLSERELDVLRLIAEGRSNREIGDRLFISQHTAANHVRSILQKTGCANRAEAAAYAVHRRVVHQ